MNNIFKLRENMYNLRNFHIFQIDNLHLLKYSPGAIPYCASHLWQQTNIHIGEVASQAFFENHIGT